MTPLILGLLGLAFHTAGSEGRRFEALAASDIRAKLQGEAVRVSVKTELADWLTGPFGNLARVTIRASDFTTEGLPLFTEPERGTRGKIGELRLILDRFSLGHLRIEHL